MDAVGAEAKAFKVGISYARDVGVAEFILEVDSLIISDALCEQPRLLHLLVQLSIVFYLPATLFDILNYVNNPHLLHLLVQLSMVFYLPATLFNILNFPTLEDKVMDLLIC